MRKALLGLTVLVVLIPAVATAGWQPLTGDPVSLASLEGESIIVGDKEFSDFELIGGGQGGAIAPDPAAVLVQGGWDAVTGDYGLRFVLSWGVGSGQIINANLNFTVAILDLPQWEDWYIEDCGIVLTGASATSTGVVNASETVWDGPIPNGGVLASLSVSKQQLDGGAYLVDWAVFRPVKMVWVRKDISIAGGTGPGGAAHLSEVFQFYSQVPEPTAVAIIVVGAVVLLRRRRHAWAVRNSMIVG